MALPAIFFAILLKAVIILISAEEVNRAYIGETGISRYVSILSARSKIHYFQYFIFSIVWYLAFFFIGLSVIVISSIIRSFAASWIFTIIIAITLFPIFYSGISVAGFYYSLTNIGENGNLNIHLFRAINENRLFIYMFYFVRSCIEVLALVIIPAIMPTYIESEIASMVICVSIAILTLLYMRTSATIIKRRIFDMD